MASKRPGTKKGATISKVEKSSHNMLCFWCASLQNLSSHLYSAISSGFEIHRNRRANAKAAQSTITDYFGAKHSALIKAPTKTSTPKKTLGRSRTATAPKRESIEEIVLGDRCVLAFHLPLLALLQSIRFDQCQQLRSAYESGG